LSRRKKRKPTGRLWLLLAIVAIVLVAAGYVLGSHGSEPTVPGTSPGLEDEEDPAQALPEPDPPTISIGQELLVPVPEVATGQASTVIDRADPSRPGRVALTFDAGWIYEPVPDLLQALREHDVCATFFLRGGFVKDHPDLVQQIAAAGHLIANHSYTHGHMTTQTQAEQIDELERTNQLILDLTGQRPYLFRPPYGEYNGDLLRTAAACGFPYTVMWTVDSLDWMEPGVDEIYERVSTRLVDGAIVLMHVGSTQTPEVLPRLINLIREQGYELGTIPDMLPEEVFTGRQTYIVQAGDTLASIARKYGTEVEKLIEINNL
jgi:peptidoglycan/xylan/chitin deacetylase (PgdA/CDA1 family)